ncbi:hypothetical protein [Dactylosporangium sp. CA-139066]|uniref:hypothetical protein n=1 Tax=Dactylosporangium sp. CA-139066 TaxID=3239930 RepID=UPI003D93957B
MSGSVSPDLSPWQHAALRYSPSALLWRRSRTTSRSPGRSPAFRRIAATLAASLVAVAIAVFGFADDAEAHGGVILTLHGDGQGSVWLTVAWQDGHPVTEPVGMTMLATSATGQRVGPAPLKRNGDALTYSGTLAPGDWTVVADMGTPAIGRCEGVIHVAAAGASAAPDEKTCAPPPAPATTAAAPAPSGGGSSWVWYTGGAVVLAGLVALFVVRRR